MDYLDISRSIQDTMRKAGCPLTEDQGVMLSGCLSVYFQGTQQDEGKILTGPNTEPANPPTAGSNKPDHEAQ